MGYADSLVNYLTNDSIRFLKKVLFVILTTIGLFVIDNVFGFSYYYNVSSKTEQVKELNKLITDHTLSTYEVQMLKRIRTEVLSRHSFLEKDFVSPFVISFDDGRNSILHFVSASWFILVMALILPFLGLYHPNLNFEVLLIIIVIFEPLILLLAWIFAKILSAIPVIGTPWISYILNFFLILILAGIFKTIRDVVKKTLDKRWYKDDTI